MGKIIYFPLEHIDSRYTTHMDRDIVKYFEDNRLEYLRIYPEIVSPGLKPGMFLDANFTTKFKTLQLSALSDLYQNNLVHDDDILFFSDLWFPGIESISYMNHFNKVSPKIRGIIHAGSFTDTDEVRNLERWAKNFEDIIFDITDRVYLGSEFIKEDILKKRNANKLNLEVTGLPLDYEILNQYNGQFPKENIVIFNGRNHPEKQPELFLKCKEHFKNSGWKFIWTQQMNLDKKSYYELLAKSKVILSFALQENFGYGIQEAVYLGTYPILPNRLAYSEQFGVDHLYNSFDECVSKISNAMQGNRLQIRQKNTINNNIIFYRWFN